MAWRSTTQKGVDFIKSFESFVPVPYICPAGYWTIAWGHLIKPGEKFVKVDEATGEIILKKDLRGAEGSVLRLINIPLDDDQFDALVSFAFNLGGGALQRSTLRIKVNREDHEDVPDEFRRWVYSKGRKLPGLIRRRNDEAMMYQSLFCDRASAL